MKAQPIEETGFFKDAVLDRLAERANVAQFVSFGPGSNPTLRFMRIVGYLNESNVGVSEVISELLRRAPERSVNVRSYDPVQPRSNDFFYGLREAGEVLETIHRLANEGLYTIVNETIDVDDGGVSGVAHSDLIEVAPGDTPRCVEKPGTVSLSRDVGLFLLQKVYGFTPDLDYSTEMRVEFSIHPSRRGHRHGHTVIWEMEDVGRSEVEPKTRWPNLLSRMLGDKAFGLLVADSLGLPVPRTTVVGRSVAPFEFGTPTGTDEHWIRTCPREQAPGKFSTHRGWVDPFVLMHAEDPSGESISSVLRQDAVDPHYSGALLTADDGQITIEGVQGSGEGFMLGLDAPVPLPDPVIRDVLAVQGRAGQAIGPVRMEWVHDGKRAWVVQLHSGPTRGVGHVLVPGDPETYRQVRADEGIGALRAVIDEMAGSGDGIALVGDVGVTSHMGDLLRRSGIPSRIEPAS